MAEISTRFQGITGSAIRKILGLSSQPGMISFAGGNPSPRTFPSGEIAEIARSLVLEQGARVLQYGETRGVRSFLDVLRELNAQLMKPDDDVITLSGSSQGIDLFARTYLDDGDCVLVEGPTFLGAIQTIRLAGGRVVSVPLEDDGVNLEALRAQIRENHPKFFYTIPTFQNPTGITTCAEKRKAVYEICAEAEVAVLEDDPYGQLRFDGEHLAPIKSYDNGTVVTRLCSFSKTISPGIRVGYAVGPREVIRCFELLKQGADVHTPNLNQDIVSEYLRLGYYPDHIREIRDVYRKQRDAMLDALGRHAPDGVTYTRPEGGLFLWATLPESMNAEDLFNACVEKNIVFVPGTSFYAEGGHENTMRLNYSMPDIEQIREGIARLCDVIREQMEKSGLGSDEAGPDAG